MIKVKHAGVNPIDWLNLEGVLQDMLPHEFPLIPGWDAAGIVEDIGSQASQFKVGDKVFTCCLKPVVKDGSFAEYLVVDESQVAPMPSNFNFSEAAATPLAALTAFQALHESLVIAIGQSIVITGAAGGVGSFAVQIAKLAGAKVIAIASERHHEYLKDLGADFVVDYSSQDVSSEIKKNFPQGADLGFNCFSARTNPALMESLVDSIKVGGRITSIAGSADESALKNKNITFDSIFIRADGKQLAEISKCIEQKKVKVHVEKVFPLDKLAEAFHLSEKSKVRGKLTVEIG